MYRYQVKPGAENRVFGGDGVRNLGGGIVESDHELNSPYLDLHEDSPAQQTQMISTPDPTPQLPPAAPAPGLPETVQPETQGEAS